MKMELNLKISLFWSVRPLGKIIAHVYIDGVAYTLYDSDERLHISGENFSLVRNSDKELIASDWFSTVLYELHRRKAVIEWK
jgi:hypothetical protein